jgi:transcriptional regulator with XRE-family HTH domain
VSRKDTAARDQAKTWVAELRSVRLAGGFPREQIAEALAVGSATVRSWEDRRRIPTLINLIRFGRELGLRLVIVDQDGRAHPGRIAVRPGESWEYREIRKLAAALRSQRRGCALSQHAIALATDASETSIAQFESGRLHPRPAMLAAWAAAVGCRVRWQTLV